MYNGIGLQTPRGSGTNGHVQRNWAIVRKTKDKVNYKSDDGKLDQLNKQPNKEILDHVRKRKIEVKCAEHADILEEQGFTADEVKIKVEAYRSMLMGSDAKPPVPQDEFGRINVRETHQVAEAQQEKNAKLREAFGISEFFVEGSSLDPERHAREAEARAAASKVYELVRTPSPVPLALSTSVPNAEAAVTQPEKKAKRKRSGSSTKKKKKEKKHKRDRSESPKVSKKKDKSKKKKKDKKHKKAEVSSSDSDSSDDSDNSSSSEAESKKKRKKKKKKSKSDVRDKHEKKKAPVKRKHQTSESSSESSPDPPKKTGKRDKSSDKLPRENPEVSVAAAIRETQRQQVRSPPRLSSRAERNPGGSTPVVRVRDSSPHVSSTNRRAVETSGGAFERAKERFSPAPRDQRSPCQTSKRNRSSSRGRGGENRANIGRNSPRRYSRSRRPVIANSPSPPARRRRQIGASRSPKRRGRYSYSRSRSRSRYERYVPRRRASPSRQSSQRRRRSNSRRRSRSPRPRDNRVSLSSRNRRVNDATSRDRRRVSRSRSRSRSRRSSLSYSPVQRNPDRYRDILRDERKRGSKSGSKRRDVDREDRENRTDRCNEEDEIKRYSPKARKSSSPSRTKKMRVVAPRVSLRSSSDEETEVIVENETKQREQEEKDDEERQREINTLKRLQSGLAAKARETLGKKVTSPTKIKVEKREDQSCLLDIALPSEPPKIMRGAAAPTSRDTRSTSRSKSPDRSVRTPISSRSPSPALPLTRAEAEIETKSSVESPPRTNLAISRSSRPSRSPPSRKRSSPVTGSRMVALTSTRDSNEPSVVLRTNQEESTSVKLRSPTESPPRAIVTAEPIRPSWSTIVKTGGGGAHRQTRSPIETRISPERKKSCSRSPSRSYTRSRSMEKRRLSRSPRRQSNDDVSPRAPSRGENNENVTGSPPLRKNKSPTPPIDLPDSRSSSRTKQQSPKLSVKSKRSRDSRSSSTDSRHSIASKSSTRTKNIRKSLSRTPTKVTSRSRSRSRSLPKRSRSRSTSKKSRSPSRSVSRSPRDKAKHSRSRSSSRSSRSSTRRSRRSFSSSSRSSSSGSSRSSRSSSSSSGSSRSRSPSIPRRHGSPSFLDRRRITSARKRPIPYHRPTPSPPSSPSSSTSSRNTEWSSPSRRSSRSPTRSPSYNR